jgi:hypothetical protein
MAPLLSNIWQRILHRWIALVKGASSESKKIYVDFFILEKIAKNQKIHIFGSHSKKWVQWPELLLYLNSTDPLQ